MNLLLNQKYTSPPSLDNSKNSGGIPAGQPAANDKQPQITGKTFQEMKIMRPFQKLPEIQKIFKKILPKIPQNLPKSTQEMTHKKLKKLLTQEAKNITYAQTLTQTTQTHTDIKRQIKRLGDLNYILWSPSPFFFS